MTYKPKTHQTYAHRITGEYLPGVTTITGRHPDGKAAMLNSAVKLTKEGIDFRKLWDFKANIGTCCHEMVQNHIMELGPINEDLWPKNVLKRAKIGFRAFKKWEKEYKPVYMGSELQVVNSHEGYGGTLDIWALLGMRQTVLDIKTGNWYPTAEMQIIALENAIIEEKLHAWGNSLSDGFSHMRGDPIGLQLNCDNGSYIVHHISQSLLDKRWRQFVNLLEGYKLEKGD